MEKDKLEKIILGTATTKKNQRSDLPTVRALSESFQKSITKSGAPVSTWYRLVIEKFEQYRAEFNRARSEEALTIDSQSVDGSKHEFESCSVALRVQQTDTTIGFLLKYDSQSAFDLMAEFENELEHDSPETLRFESQDITIRNLNEPLRKIFGLFIEAVTENLENLSKTSEPSAKAPSLSSVLGNRPAESDEPDFTCAEDFVVSPLSALLGPIAKEEEKEEKRSEARLLTNLLEACAEKENSEHSQNIFHGEIQTNQGEPEMLQTKEVGLIDSLDQVKQSVERELIECAKQGARAFETRDMRAIQGAAARMDKVQTMKNKIDATLDDWIRELSE
jgi:hypothetical protein